MPNNCINRRCVLLNLVYNAALNNVLSGIGILFQGNVQELSAALVMVGLGVLLVFGVRKGDRSLLLTFLILEPFLLSYYTIKGAVETVHCVQDPRLRIHLFNILAIVGNIVGWILVIPVYMVYKNIRSVQKEDTVDGNESKDGCGNESKSVAV